MNTEDPIELVRRVELKSIERKGALGLGGAKQK